MPSGGRSISVFSAKLSFSIEASCPNIVQEWVDEVTNVRKNVFGSLTRMKVRSRGKHTNSSLSVSSDGSCTPSMTPHAHNRGYSVEVS